MTIHKKTFLFVYMFVGDFPFNSFLTQSQIIVSVSVPLTTRLEWKSISDAPILTNVHQRNSISNYFVIVYQGLHVLAIKYICIVNLDLFSEMMTLHKGCTKLPAFSGEEHTKTHRYLSHLCHLVWS